MIYHLSLYITEYIPLVNIVHYISFRIVAALLTSLTLSFLWGNWFIEKSKQLFRSKARENTPKNHRLKDNMPTMGGIFIIINIIITALLWSNLTNLHIWTFLFCLISFGTIGLWDDLRKINKQNGISAAFKFTAQLLCALITCFLLLQCNGMTTKIIFPFFKHLQPNISFLFIPWAIFILVGTSNAVNLTDGLDGLAIGSLLLNFCTFSFIAYIAGHFAFASYLHIPFAQTSEVSILGAAFIGSSLGFLWYNTYPAAIFMGDVGSLSLGACLALIALSTKQELLLPISGGLFVIETISVILQTLSYKFYKKRIFKMAPIHHHFELLGWQESQITIRFGIITFILCLLALITLKIR